MEKIIFKNFLREISFFFILSSLSIALIIWIIQAVNYLDFVSEDGHNFKVYFLYTILLLPKIFSRILPFMFFISIFYIILKYEEKNQLLIFWSNGINKKQFSNVIFKFSIIFFLIQIFLTAIVVPDTQNKARSYIRNSNIDFFPSLIKPRKFIDTVEDLTIFVNAKDDNETLRNIVLKDNINKKASQIIIAKNGKIVQSNNNKFLVLNKGKIININNQGRSTIFNFKKTEFDLNKFSTKTTTFPKVQEQSTLKLFNCAHSLTNQNIKFTYYKNMHCEKSYLKNIKQELLKRIFLPLYLPLLALVACFLIIKSKDNHEYTHFKFKLFLIGIIFLIISEVSIRYAGLNNKYNLIFILIPITLFISARVIFVNQLKFEK
jgi:lipopolysaccharide export system permease protein